MTVESASISYLTHGWHIDVSKPLKEQNRWYIWLIIFLNISVFYVVSQAASLKLSELLSILKDTDKLMPIGVATIVAIVLNGLLSADTKYVLVFLRWKHTLPGHRAFSKYAKADPRIDMAQLRKAYGKSLPKNPNEENKVWFRFYKDVEDKPSVLQVHRDFLLLRDYTGLSILFLLIFGGASFYIIGVSNVLYIYVAFLFVQYIIVRQSASNYGVRFVKTVLAEKSVVKT